MTCNLLLVDDHSLIRAGVRALVMDIPGYAVIGEANDGAQVLEMVERLSPDIILLDISMKDVSGLEALKKLKVVHPQSKVLILSMHTDPALIMQALESGAHGYLLKDTTANELEHALEALRNNERYLSPAIAHTVINQALIRVQKPHPEPVETHNLTARQLEILRLIVRGKSTREIAHGLGLSIKTVETHRSQIMKRLQIYDVAGLVLFAVREQIISLDD
ncbi:Two-component transcriptional response regulator, LuxR family [Pseudomonas chlororaphis subsp. aurantiaca]|uniref:Response regulator transcription factor n=2 Tax=Pseudomonas chlororaphis TaxID=587753 RepID=A0AAJ0ZJV3_9PSED|nr:MULTISPECIES: response regulator transcription factor [Pseudomonas]AIS11984.1 LuxR family transcriptional regulator [Pseudomonas chlororaphis subsp. aurantiaca]AVO60323.1 DNA-binding response regulator [Pseudomonas chlororaphis subsp. piscium]AZC32510.1 Two-component transcriptional response regulator, LuxR family [Pseudomonas chlororaphis subsp. piscium]AZC38917.1 Two-component transcriptional response regulator, LuxR family [Pseudomonas chlororaphis subsp. piscium]AZC45467.1 Two-component